MARFRETVQIPANEVKDINDFLIRDGERPEASGSIVQEATFGDNYRLTVTVEWTPDTQTELYSRLYDHAGDEVQDDRWITGPLDQDYVFEEDNDTYTLKIVRTANSVLTPEATAHYLSTGGVRCPFCKADDLHGGFVETNEGRAEQPIDCLACGANWHDIYNLAAIERNVPPEPPTPECRRSARSVASSEHGEGDGDES